APHLLLCEALGFSPQLLLDDIINIANNAVQDGVNGMEEFLQKWADERAAQASAGGGATTHEVEQGLVAFQTLLEYHTDIAFDFFEAWCLRNIFMIPPELGGHIVLPHQEGLDLSVTPEEEQAAVEEVEELRRRLDGHRKLNRLLTRAIRTSTRQLTHAESRLSSLSHLSSLAPPSPSSSRQNPPQTPLATIPPRFLEMYQALSSPSLPPTSSLPPPASGSAGSGKREWETGKTGYVNWALGRLLVKGQGQGQSPSPGHTPVDKLDRAAASVGSGEEIRAALEVVGGLRRELDEEL
ncbi:hypothetical protein GALMADRAFT_20169, partial [Galerina marginata CBS 339.88]